MPHHNCPDCDLSAGGGREMVVNAIIMLQNAIAVLSGIGQNAWPFCRGWMAHTQVQRSGLCLIWKMAGNGCSDGVSSGQGVRSPFFHRQIVSMAFRLGMKLHLQWGADLAEDSVSVAQIECHHFEFCPAGQDKEVFI